MEVFCHFADGKTPIAKKEREKQKNRGLSDVVVIADVGGGPPSPNREFDFSSFHANFFQWWKFYCIFGVTQFYEAKWSTKNAQNWEFSHFWTHHSILKISIFGLPPQNFPKGRGFDADKRPCWVRGKRGASSCFVLQIWRQRNEFNGTKAFLKENFPILFTDKGIIVVVWAQILIHFVMLVLVFSVKHTEVHCGRKVLKSIVFGSFPTMSPHLVKRTVWMRRVWYASYRSDELLLFRFCFFFFFCNESLKCASRLAAEEKQGNLVVSTGSCSRTGQESNCHQRCAFVFHSNLWLNMTCKNSNVTSKEPIIQCWVCHVYAAGCVWFTLPQSVFMWVMTLEVNSCFGAKWKGFSGNSHNTALKLRC